MVFAVQATVEEYRASQQQLEARLAEAADKFEAAQKAAASEAHAAEQRLTKIQVRTTRCALQCAYLNLGPSLILGVHIKLRHDAL